MKSTLLAAALAAFSCSPALENTNVRDMLNNAETSWAMGENQTACLSIQIAIASTGPQMDAQLGRTTEAQKADLRRYARRCNLRY